MWRFKGPKRKSLPLWGGGPNGPEGGGPKKKAPDFSGAFPIVFEVDAYEA